MDTRKIKICEILFELLEAGYRVDMGESSIYVKETFKSQSRDKWEEKTVNSIVASFDYFREEGNVLNIVLEDFIKWKNSLLLNKEFPLTPPTINK